MHDTSDSDRVERSGVVGSGDLDRRAYWRANLRIAFVLLAVWAVAGLGCGVLFADHLNAVRLGGFPLGFWFAQQGSIAVFVVLILVYAIAMNRLDRRHAPRGGVAEEDGA